MRHLRPLTCFALAMLCFLFGSASTHAQSKPKSPISFHAVSNGDGAVANWIVQSPDGSEYSYVYLSVSRGGTVQNPTTNLYYYGYGWNSSGSWYFGGMGDIPNGAFTVQGNCKQGTYKLVVDTSVIPGFELNYHNGGPIDLEWNANGAWFDKNTGSSQYEDGFLRQRRNGTWEEGSATLTGSFMGSELPPQDTWAPYSEVMMVSSHQAQIDITILK